MQWIEQNLVWFGIGALVVLALLGSFRWELPSLAWREIRTKLGAPIGSADIAPPPEHGHRSRDGHRSQTVAPQKPSFHRSGRRSGH